ncbi:microtubule-associated protein 10 [Centroberyx affinis]|uniref:microtubule-associated protein 10 n=1 Tax=Centroberyx affinis TaxID=166261 RepID=UPI003A5BA380
MSAQPNSDNLETLFSLELLVEYIRIDKERKVSDELALGVRLLDFPTLLIYQAEQRSGGIHQQQHRGEDNRGEYAFNRGKSCLFKINLDSLHTHLSNTPLYAMVLDVKDEIPKLVGTALISLAKLVDRIRRDVNAHGISTPSSQGENKLVDICNLMGDKIGSVSLAYKLSSLGTSLLPHISEKRVCKISGGQHIKENSNVTKDPLLFDSGQGQSHSLDNKSDLCKDIQMNGPSNEAKQDDAVCVATQTEHRPRGKGHQSFQRNDYSFEEDLTVFCPPRLFYSSSVEKTRKNEGADYKLLKLDLESLMLEDVSSEEETPENEIEGSRPLIDQRATSNQEHQGASGVPPNVLGEALKQLPLLNALLVELSQLNGQNPQQPLSVHPNLAWIYRPSPEPAAGQVNTTPKAQTKLLHKSRQVASPRLIDLHSPRNCSTPRVKPVSERSKHTTSSHRKKLMYGTTKTFRLRLKLIPPDLAKRHECMETQTEAQTSKTKGKTLNTSNKMIKRTKRKALNQSSNLDENVETVISGITCDSALQETDARKHRHEDANKSVGIVCCKQDNDSQKLSGKPSRSEADMKRIHIPSVDGGDVTQNRDKRSHRSESRQTQPEPDRNREEMETPGSSRKSSYSDSSGEGEEEGEYMDDFTSLEPSDGYSPDLLSSPEPAVAKRQKEKRQSPVCGTDSDSGSFRKRAVPLPAPVKAPGSPQRSLRATHVIRPRTQASALSVSTDVDDDGDGSASVQTVRSRTQTAESGRAKRTSGTESLRWSRSGESASTNSSTPVRVRVVSAESISSFEPQEAEEGGDEVGDELGSLGFKNKYQHISELVANKLPGYTV